MKEFEVGMSALDVCKTIVASQPIEELKIISHEVGFNWSQKYLTEEERRENFIEAYIYDTPPKSTSYFSKKEFLKTSLDDMTKNNDPYDVISFVSAVETTDKKSLHIPMMNFHPESGFGLDEIRKALKYVTGNKDGVILESGRFYHYYGDFLLDQREWEKFMGKFLIPFNLVHPGYVGYRLQYGYSTLRLSSDKKFKTKKPEVIEVLY